MTFRQWWMAMGILIVAVIWIGSLMPAPPRLPGGDKFHHFAGYAACSFCWSALVMSLRGKLGWILVFTAMGVLIEFLQGATGARHFERADMIANALGAVAGGTLTFVLPRAMLTRMSGSAIPATPTP